MKTFESMETSSSVALAAVVTALLVAWFANAVDDSAARGQAIAKSRSPAAATVAGDGETLVITAGRLPPARAGVALPNSARAARQPSS
jgi:hypothetical protein